MTTYRALEPFLFLLQHIIGATKRAAPDIIACHRLNGGEKLWGLWWRFTAKVWVVARIDSRQTHCLATIRYPESVDELIAGSWAL